MMGGVRMEVTLKTEEEVLSKDVDDIIRTAKDEKVLLGIVNKEYEEVSYWVEIKIEEVINKQIGPVVLAHEEKWEEEVSFIPPISGEYQKVEFILYKTAQEEPYLTLHLWIDVKK